MSEQLVELFLGYMSDEDWVSKDDAETFLELASEEAAEEVEIDRLLSGLVEVGRLKRQSLDGVDLYRVADGSELLAEHSRELAELDGLVRSLDQALATASANARRVEEIDVELSSLRDRLILLEDERRGVESQYQLAKALLGQNDRRKTEERLAELRALLSRST